MIRPLLFLRHEEKGVALLSVLLLVAIIGIIAATALDRLSLATRLAANMATMAQGRGHADSALQLALVRVGDLKSSDIAPSQWQGKPLRYTLEGGGIINLQLADGGNCFNLNSLANENPVMAKTAESQLAGLLASLGIANQPALSLAAATADYVDADDIARNNGAEDAVYRAAKPAALPPNHPMATAQELGMVHGMTPAVLSRISKWVCALPSRDLTAININSLQPSQLPLLAMLAPDKISIEKARSMLAARPAQGFSGSFAFWNTPAAAGLTIAPDVASQIQVETSWFRLDTDIDYAETTIRESALIDARSTSPALVYREARTAG
jgi:general secretion pathway protein K